MRFEGCSGNSSDGDGIANGIENFDGIAFRTVGGNVVIHQLDDISSFEAVLRQIARDYRIFV